MNEWIKALVESYFKDADELASGVQGLENYSESELERIVADWFRSVENDCGFDAGGVLGVFLHGSRLRGTARPDSDLDAVVFYSGSAREDALFDALNDPDAPDGRLEVDGIAVDVNPMRVSDDPAEAADEIRRYAERSREYDREVLAGRETAK